MWNLSYNSSRGQLLSCSADSNVKLWSPTAAKPLVASYGSTGDDGQPTSCDWVHQVRG